MQQIAFHTHIRLTDAVAPGVVVDFGTPIARKTQTRQEKLSVTDSLGISPKDIFLHLLKVVGEEVKKDELLAEKKGMFGTKQLISEFTGTIREINHEDGTVTMEMKTEVNQEEYAYFTGRIADHKDQTIMLEVKEFKSYELKDASGDFGGEILKTTQDALVTLNSDTVANKVVIIDAIKPADIVRLDVLDERGLVTLKDVGTSNATPWARIKNLPDWDEIMRGELRYCIIDKKNNTMYLYN